MVPTIPTIAVVMGINEIAPNTPLGKFQAFNTYMLYYPENTTALKL